MKYDGQLSKKCLKAFINNGKQMKSKLNDEQKLFDIPIAF